MYQWCVWMESLISASLTAANMDWNAGSSLCFRLGVQPRLHQRGHGEGTPAASQWRHPHPDVRPSAYDPVRLQPQPGQSGSLQQPQVHLLDERPHQGVEVWAYESVQVIISSTPTALKHSYSCKWVLHYVYYIYAMMLIMQQNHSTDQFM